MKYKQGIAPLLLVIILALLLGGGYFAVQKLQSNTQKLEQTPPPVSGATNVPKDWKTYRNEKYGFEFRYPAFPTGTQGKHTEVFVEENSTNEPFFSVYFCSDLSCFMDQDYIFVKPALSSELDKFEKGFFQPGFTCSKECSFPSDAQLVKSTITVSGRKALIFKEKDTSSSYRVLNLVNKGYLFIVKTGNWPTQLFDSILSTFKFTK